MFGAATQVSVVTGPRPATGPRGGRRYPDRVTQTLLGGRYRLDEPIGRGGMAAVWRATDTVLNREVAVKRLHAGLIADEELIERFEREALLVARLSHPHLVHVLDRGDDGDGPYLVLELVQGENLKARIRREGPLDPGEAARICAEVARALDYAHGQGVIHRDIKAQNVLLTEDGVAKLADFGIARMMEGDGEGGLTRTDMLLGSADYLSPEQANGRPLDARSDVYSLGVVLYECLTATLPFMGDGFVAVAMKHCSEPFPDPRAAAGAIPPWLADVVMHATRKDPAERFASAGAMAQALEDGPAGAPLHQGTAVMPAIEAPQEATDPTGPRRPAFGPGGPRQATPAPAAGKARTRRAGRWVAATLVVLVAAAAALGAGLWLTDGDPAAGDGPAGDDGEPVALAIAAVRDLDPEDEGGDGAENPDSAYLAVDGDPETAWYTERYQDDPRFGGLKDGVGLALRLEAPAVPTDITVESPTPGAEFEVQAGGLGGPRTVLADGAFEDAPVTVELDDAGPQQTLILWITSLADTDDGRYHAGVAEVRLQGVPEAPGP